ncbi:GlxA family transcriptional regulator [Rhizobium ruizarguesonis]|uniref:GlxA family transcriptional regulator n=1 Tax=Rhizobium ruizarguesonis TaxID=2081791 RepID=UPI001031D017|nr:GlxA family transcriptional regulator [Rhizobium ruizarguesonis]NEJ02796.1 helix-turn-helix domain-containing protein [Rhizobium ruizarguesonis]NEJ40610.1 helix-turn-helix domain-containing protein [Rhizobium ruizarguesonis]TAX67275.1 GlxA family transcriptional regulator [Rhizobium ruizarguesonis]TAY27895.1 GlxA family transcriptional regulator [Rhizobium ruizarguesonis]TAY45018.1 GlxA family transcriptional regulator [Rhizobium ruizarguesonis]
MERSNFGVKHMAFYVLDQFSLRALSAALTVLRLANETSETAVYEWRVVSQTGGSVVSACGLELAADVSIDEERELLLTDRRAFMAVICGGHEMPAAARGLTAWVRECALHRICIGTLAGGAFIPAAAGLHRNKRWAVHWEHFPVFNESFPEITATQSLYEIDGDLFSCAGGDASFDMFLRFVERDVGLAGIDRICEKAMVDRMRPPGERQRLPLQTRFGVAHPAVVKVIEQMEANLVQPLRLDKLAPSSGLSRRQIERLFFQQLGRTPARYYLELRLEKGELLIKHSALPIIDVAMACGFVSGSHFTKSYRSHYGATPQQHRMAALAERSRPAARRVIRRSRTAA